MKGMQKISRGSGFKGVLSYAFEGEKKETGHGRLLGGNMASTGISSLAAEFRAIAARRSDIEKPVWHNSLRMPAGEDISDERWVAVGKSYLKRMGFDLKNTQFSFFKHADEHVHLIVNRVLIDGTVFLGQNENLKSTRVIGELERAFKLTVTRGPSYSAEGKLVMPEKTGLKKAELEMALRTETKPARLMLQELVAGAMKGRPTTRQFLERLDVAGVMAVPNIASTGRMNGLSFEWDGVAFTGSQLGAAYKWTALQKELIYDQDADRAELARRQSEARDRRANAPAADRLAGAAPEPVGPAAAAQRPADADRGAAGDDFFAGGRNPAAGAGAARDHSAAAVAQGHGSAAPGDRGGAAQGSERPPHAAGQRGDHGDGRQGGERGEGQPQEAGHGVPAGQRRAVASAGEPGELERAQTIRVLLEIARPAVVHDEALKVKAWRQQAAALGAPAYRLTVQDGMRPQEKERTAPRIGQSRAGEPAPDYSAAQIEDLIPELRACNKDGFDVYVTPVDGAHHYLLVQGMTPQRLDGLRAEGYVPALAQQCGEADLQAILKVPRESGREDEQRLADALSLELNERFGTASPAGAEANHALPMAGFTHHRPKKKGALTVILEALGALCRRTLAHLQSLRFKADEKKANEAREEAARQAVQTSAQRAARVAREPDARAYRLYAAPFAGASPDEVDLEVAKNMLKARLSQGEVSAALRTSPGLARRHPDADQYVKEAVKNARKVLDASAP